jgi:DNA-directed RNA polymerase subunit M/transcription elongation factor TFIIS
MSQKKIEIQRHLHRTCPKCNSDLEIISYITIKRGKEYKEKFIECVSCDYFKKINVSNKRSNFNEDEL